MFQHIVQLLHRPEKGGCLQGTITWQRVALQREKPPFVSSAEAEHCVKNEEGEVFECF
jgi:hypothetical protein